MDHTSDWQTKLSSVRERNLHALNNSLFCDVEFFLQNSNGDRFTVAAHKYVLAVSSPVFGAMFFGQLAEKQQTIELKNCTKEGLEELLRYVYTDQVNLTGNNVMELMFLADKYMLPFLVEKCTEYLEKELKPEDVFSILPEILKIENKKAIDHCWDIVDMHTLRAVTSDSFLNVSHEMLCEILARDGLNIEEIELFKAVDRWASFKVNNKKKRKSKDGLKRAELGDKAVRLIRFPVMSQKEFAEHVLPTDILLKNEMVEVMQIFSSVEPQASLFNSKRRKGQQRKRWSDIRFHILSSTKVRLPYPYIKARSRNPACIDFHVNKAVSLAGVRLFGYLNRDYQVNMKIYQAKSHLNFLLYQSNGHVSYKSGIDLINGLYPGFEVLIDPPVPLDKDTRYTIEADIRGPHYGSENFSATLGKDFVECDDVKISFVTSSRDRSFTTVDDGQFPAVLLKWP